MIEFGWKLDDLKRGFFDRPAVVRAVDKTSHKALSKFGAFVMKTAKDLIRKAPKTLKTVKDRRGKEIEVRQSSKPYRPPISHTGLLKQNIFFAYDDFQKSVIIGPAYLGTASLFGNSEQTPTEVLEYGGTTVVKGSWDRRRIKVAPRPFMGPAYDKEEENLPKIWQDALTK